METAGLKGVRHIGACLGSTEPEKVRHAIVVKSWE